jgi:hypothetical protein
MTDKILIDRAVAEKALELLRESVKNPAQAHFNDLLSALVRVFSAVNDALEHADAIDTTEKRVEKAMENEHKPVAWMDSEGRIYFHDITETCAYHGFPLPTLLYPHPPRREWLGLKPEEIKEVVHNTVEKVTVSESVLFRAVARDIEAALKEKNNG